MTDESLADLEQIWMNRIQASDDVPAEEALGNDSVGMDFFYGNCSQEDSSVVD